MHSFTRWVQGWQARIGAWILVLCLVGYPIVALLVTLLGVESATLSWPYRAIVALGAVVLLASGLRHPLRGQIDGVFLVFLLIYALRLIYDVLISDVFLADVSLRFYLIVVFFPVLAVALSGAVHLDDTEIAYRLAAAGFVCLGLAIVATSQGLVSAHWFYDGAGGGRLAFDSLNPITLGHAAVSTLLACLVLLTTPKVDWRWKAFSIVLMASATFIVFKSASKGPLLAMVLAVAWFAFSRVGRLVKLAPLVFCLPFFASVYDPILSKSLEADVAHLVDPGGDEGLLRLGLGLGVGVGEAVVDDFLAFPILGRHSYNDVMGEGFYPHNVIIETAMALGVVGLGLLVVVLVQATRNVLAFFNRQHPLLVMLLIQHGLNSQLSGAIWGSDAFFALLALALAPNPETKSATLRYRRT